MEEKKRKRLYLTMDEWRISPHFIDLGHVEDHETIELILVTSDDLSGAVTAEFALGKTRALAPQVSTSDGAIIILFTAAMLSEPGLGSLQIVEHYPDGAMWHSSILQYRVRDSIKANATVPEEQLTAFDRALSSYAKQMSLVTETNQIAKDALEKATEAETSVKSLTNATETDDGLMSKADKTKLDALQGPLIVYATKKEKASDDTSTTDTCTLDHTAKEIYEAMASGRVVQAYVNMPDTYTGTDGKTQDLTLIRRGIDNSYPLEKAIYFLQDKQYSIYFYRINYDKHSDAYTDGSDKVTLRGLQVQLLRMWCVDADATEAEFVTYWWAYDGRPALDLVKQHIRSELAQVSEQVTELNNFSHPLIVYATKQEKAATDVFDKYTLDHPAKEIYEAAASGREVRVYVRRSAVSQSVTDGISASYVLSSFTLFKKEPVKYTVFFKASSSDSLGGDEQYEDQNEKVYVKGNKVTMLYLSMQPADGTQAISSTWSAYDERPALDLVKTHIRSELSAVSDRVTKLESSSSGTSKLVLTATATGKSNTAGAALYSLGKTRSEVYQAVQDGTDVEVRFHDDSQNVDVILRPAYIGPSSNGLHQITFSGVYAFGASQVTAIYYYALQYDMVDEDNFILLSRRTD